MLGDQLLVGHGVLQAENRGFGRNFGLQLFQRHRGIISLDRQADDIIRLILPVSKGRAGWRSGDELSVLAAELEACLLNFFHVRRVPNEQHLCPSFRQVAAYHTAHRSGAKNDKTHMAPFFIDLQVMRMLPGTYVHPPGIASLRALSRGR